MCDKTIEEKKKRDTGGGCSICGRNPAVNVDGGGSYWLCGECVAEKFTELRERNKCIYCGSPNAEMICPNCV